MTNAPVLAADYLKRARMRIHAIEALISVSDFPDAVRESQESVELAVKGLLKLKGLGYPRAHDVSRLLRDGAIAGPLLTADEIADIVTCAAVTPLGYARLRPAFKLVGDRDIHLCHGNFYRFLREI